MVWGKRCEGLHLNFTSKGKKAGTGGIMARLPVAISHRMGSKHLEMFS